MNLKEKIDPQTWKDDLQAFRDKTIAFANKEVSQKEYKGFSGYYGSYAQRGQKNHMLRLRMPAGQLSKEKLQFIVDAVASNNIDLVHFTTCQAVQLHNLKPEEVTDIMSGAIDSGIVTIGGGGDFPRNVMCTPLSGVEAGEAFDVAPYAKAASDFLMHFIKQEKMPRKLKVAFSNSKANQTHATFRDLGFVANEDGTFDVYSAGGLGANSRLGVKVADHIDPTKILYYIKAMRQLFLKHGNYENRAKARTRYMVEALGGEENYVKAFNEELAAVMAVDELDLTELELADYAKAADGEIAENRHIKAQKQPGLYTVVWHPYGGTVNLDVLKALNEAIQPMEKVELRIGPDETAYIINLTAKEAQQVYDIIKDDTANTDFESSVSCIGASICQVGIRDSQGLLKDLIQAVKDAGLKENSLPRIYISGCPSSCGTHQVGTLGLRGFVKVVDKKPQPAFMLFAYGDDEQGKERLGKEMGAIETVKLPEFFIRLGRMAEESGLSFDEWFKANPEKFEALAAEYTA